MQLVKMAFSSKNKFGMSIFWELFCNKGNLICNKNTFIYKLFKTREF